MSGYASGTNVAPDRSRAEIERMLHRFGARGFAYMTEVTDDGGERVQVAFTLLNDEGSKLCVRMSLPMPGRADDEFTKTPTGKTRSIDKSRQRYEAEVRRRWRALALVVKAKLESVESGISTVEREFMPDLVLDTGRTLSQEIAAGRLLDGAYGTRLLPPGGAS
jgi:hypothetical protein